MKAIAAMDEKRGMGYKDVLPWKPIKEDFKWFKEFTTNKILVVGRKTFDTLPLLKNRNLIVLTSCSSGYEDTYDPVSNTAFCYRNRDDIVEIDKYHKGELVVIGGAMTYTRFMPYITEFYVTHVKGTYENADTFMPHFESLFTKKEGIKEFDGHWVFKYSK